MRHWQVALAVPVGATLLAVAVGPGYVGYDAAWSLVWGAQLASGQLPGYDAAVAPTPHPLANAVAVGLSLLGDGGEHALVALSFLAFAALLAGAFMLGRRLSGWPAGAIAALVLATRGLLDREVAFASVDIPFLALLVWAAAVESQESRCGRPVLVLLALAGLLRPEAWLLSAAYGTWLAIGAGTRDRIVFLVLAVVAPLLWALSDLLVTGDPLHSFTSTRVLGSALDRPTGLNTALSQLPSSLVHVLGTPVLVAGVVGLLGAMLTRRPGLGAPLAVAIGGVLTFLAIGAAGLPVLVRYVLAPAVILTVTAGSAVAWPRSGDPTTSRVMFVMGCAAAIALLATIPRSITDVRQARNFTVERGQVHRDLRALVAGASFRAAARRCEEIRVPGFRTRPVLLLDDRLRRHRVVVGNLADGERGLLVTYASDEAAFVFNLGAPGEVRLQAAPAGARLVGRNRSWLSYAAC